MKIKLYSVKSKEVTEVALPKGFAEKINMPLLSQAVRVYEDRRHPGLAKAKTRGEVNDSTRKIYKQKGTGGARHGAKSAPNFIGGGIVHGPKGIKRILNLPTAMAQKAVKIALAVKAAQGQVVMVSGIEKIAKTKDARKFIDRITHDAVTVVFTDKKSSNRAWKNLQGVKTVDFANLNAYDVFYGGQILLQQVAKITKK